MALQVVGVPVAFESYKEILWGSPFCLEGLEEHVRVCRFALNVAHCLVSRNCIPSPLGFNGNLSLLDVVVFPGGEEANGSSCTTF